MIDMTPLDKAHAAMTAQPEDDTLRLAFFERLADAEVFLLLSEEAGADSVTPRIIESEGARYVLIFDSEERLSSFTGTVSPFTGTVSPFAGLSGRGLADLMAGQGIGLALNPEVAPSAILIPAEAVDWLASTLAHAPTVTSARPVEVTPPGALPQSLLSALARKLDGTGDLAAAAWLAGVGYEDGSRGHLLAFVDALDDAQPALAVAANEALTFSGIEAGAMDVTFVLSGTPMAERIGRVGQRIDLPRREAPETGPAAPGMDPDRPPRLR